MHSNRQSTLSYWSTNWLWQPASAFNYGPSQDAKMLNRPQVGLGAGLLGTLQAEYDSYVSFTKVLANNMITSPASKPSS